MFISYYSPRNHQIYRINDIESIAGLITMCPADVLRKLLDQNKLTRCETRHHWQNYEAARIQKTLVISN